MLFKNLLAFNFLINSFSKPLLLRTLLLSLLILLLLSHTGITVLVFTTQGELLADQNITLKQNIISCHISSFLRLNTISGTNPAFSAHHATTTSVPFIRETTPETKNE